MIRLRVWANARPMGWFGHAAAEYFFEYDAQWLEQAGAFVLAPLALWLRRSAFGRVLDAVGANPRAAGLSGLPHLRVVFGQISQLPLATYNRDRNQQEQH